MTTDDKYVLLVTKSLEAFHGKLPPANVLLIAMTTMFCPQNPTPDLLEKVGFEIYTAGRDLFIDELALAVESVYTARFTGAN